MRRTSPTNRTPARPAHRRRIAERSSGDRTATRAVACSSSVAELPTTLRAPADEATLIPPLATLVAPSAKTAPKASRSGSAARAPCAGAEPDRKGPVVAGKCPDFSSAQPDDTQPGGVACATFPVMVSGVATVGQHGGDLHELAGAGEVEVGPEARPGHGDLVLVRGPKKWRTASMSTSSCERAGKPSRVRYIAGLRGLIPRRRHALSTFLGFVPTSSPRTRHGTCPSGSAE